MRTTLDIPEKLITEAMALTKAKTKNQMIKEVLEAHIKRIKRQQLITLKVTFDFNVDLKALRGREDVEI